MPSSQAHAQALENKRAHQMAQMAQQHHQHHQQMLMLQQAQQQRASTPTPPPPTSTHAPVPSVHPTIAALAAHHAKAPPAPPPPPSTRLLNLLKSRGSRGESASNTGLGKGPLTTPAAAASGAPPHESRGTSAAPAGAALLTPPPIPEELCASPHLPRTLVGDATAAAAAAAVTSSNAGALGVQGDASGAGLGAADLEAGKAQEQIDETSKAGRKRGRQEGHEDAAHHALSLLCQQVQESMAAQPLGTGATTPEPITLEVRAGSHLRPPLDPSCLEATCTVCIAPDTEMLSTTANPHVWGQLKLCVPEESVLRIKHQRQAVHAEAQPRLESCLVMPIFSSSDASYSHPIGIAMRHSFQAGLEQHGSPLTLLEAASRWKQTARGVWQQINSSLYQQMQIAEQQLMLQQHASARHAVLAQSSQAPSPPAAPSPAPFSNAVGVA
ncbi:hypothetical protein DUNSADRAFT_3804 [Dunaliella salina]|uniref:Uncharacterized protein n=1 Tax=Dunaliella salina TaxID=3046 RepID=A0ABQ7GTA3_DUNSA|nr:hypothetical protein DUNSADRAFT_3804 [Dunaliella salina]|eukprot:KAF5837841.1 hypothetical protein DUNSADRAFT_3804 [Dunaliella salina]